MNRVQRVGQNSLGFVVHQARFFATATASATDDMTITQLNAMGVQNLAQGKIFDYGHIALPRIHGITNKKSSFHSFEDQINSQFQLDKTAPTSRDTRRVGLMGYKIGMTHFWNKWGQIVPCTVLQIDRCQITQVKTIEHDGVNSMQIGIGEQRLKNLSKPQAGHFLKNNLPPKKHMSEFKVTPENFLPVGYCLGPRHFQIGQFVDVKSISKGKGYQGPMKRWNFSGQNATHGNSLSHRRPGSIGNNEFPGKVFKGKKMAGQLGNESATVLNQIVVKIDVDRSLLYVQGNVPGCISTPVTIRDAVKKIDKQFLNLQYPTWIPPTSEEELRNLPRELSWEGPALDPSEDFYHENDVVSGKDQEED